MITIREIADDKTTISSTRWAFATVVTVDICCIIAILTVSLVCHFIDKPLDTTFYTGITALLSLITSLVAIPKTMQGFEPKPKPDHDMHKKIFAKDDNCITK